MTEETMSKIDIEIAKMQPQPLRCKFRLHKWSNWGKPSRMIDLYFSRLHAQERICLMCGIVDTREFYK